MASLPLGATIKRLVFALTTMTIQERMQHTIAYNTEGVCAGLQPFWRRKGRKKTLELTQRYSVFLYGKSARERKGYFLLILRMRGYDIV